MKKRTQSSFQTRTAGENSAFGSLHSLKKCLARGAKAVFGLLLLNWGLAGLPHDGQTPGRYSILPQASAQQANEFRLEITDEETNRPLPCRVSVRDEQGMAQKADEMPFLYDHFVIPGSVTLDWQAGTYPLVIERGLEYLPRMGHFALNRYAKDAKTETLRRFIDLSKRGWWSGDLMVMRNLEEIELLMLADDLHFVPLAESQDLQITPAQRKAVLLKRAEERRRAGRSSADSEGSEDLEIADETSESDSENGSEKSESRGAGKDSKRPNTDEFWFDSDRLFTTQNYVLRHPACSVGILNLPVPIQFQKLKLELRQSPVPLLYAMSQKYPDVWIDVQDADCWDLPLLVALDAVDSFQILGPHILRSQLLPQNINWEKIPRVKKLEKLNTQRLLEKEKVKKSRSDDSDSSSGESARLAELRRDLFLRPSHCQFIPEAAPLNYQDARGQQQWREEVYFHLLNTGHRIPPTAGSGSGLSPNPLGSNRTYVFVDPEEFAEKADRTGFQYEGANAGFTRKMWWQALKNGQCVVTNGPLLQPWVEGYVPGEVFQFPESDGESEKLNPSMTLTMQKKAQYIEIIQNGRIAQTVPFRNYAETGRLPLLEISESGWFLIRVIADDPNTYCCVMSAPYYVEMGKEKFISPKSAQFFVNWEKKRIEMLEERGAFSGENGKKLQKLHEYALEYWQDILKRSSRKKSKNKEEF